MRHKLFAILFLALPVFADSGAPGIHNFYKVNDEVYRGAQPSAEGLRYLAGIGVKTVIDLRKDGSRSREEEKLAAAAGMKYISIPMTGLTPPTEAQTEQILSMLEKSSEGPFFIHCMRGADRTGAVIAAYRIDHDKWDNARALREAMDRGMSSFQRPRQRFISNFRATDVAATQ